MNVDIRLENGIYEMLLIRYKEILKLMIATKRTKTMSSLFADIRVDGRNIRAIMYQVIEEH